MVRNPGDRFSRDATYMLSAHSYSISKVNLDFPERETETEKDREKATITTQNLGQCF